MSVHTPDHEKSSLADAVAQNASNSTISQLNSRTRRSPQQHVGGHGPILRDIDPIRSLWTAKGFKSDNDPADDHHGATKKRGRSDSAATACELKGVGVEYTSPASPIVLPDAASPHRPVATTVECPSSKRWTRLAPRQAVAWLKDSRHHRHRERGTTLDTSRGCSAVVGEESDAGKAHLDRYGHVLDVATRLG